MLRKCRQKRSNLAPAKPGPITQRRIASRNLRESERAADVVAGDGERRSRRRWQINERYHRELRVTSEEIDIRGCRAVASGAVYTQATSELALQGTGVH